MVRLQAEKGSTQGYRSQHLRIGYGGQATSCEAGPDSVLELLPSSGPLCSETPLGGWGLHSGIQGVTGQADSASKLHNEGCLKDRSDWSPSHPEALWRTINQRGRLFSDRTGLLTGQADSVRP